MTEILIIPAGVLGASGELTEAVAKMHAGLACVAVAVGRPADWIIVPQGVRRWP